MTESDQKEHDDFKQRLEGFKVHYGVPGFQYTVEIKDKNGPVPWTKLSAETIERIQEMAFKQVHYVQYRQTLNHYSELFEPFPKKE